MIVVGAGLAIDYFFGEEIDGAFDKFEEGATEAWAMKSSLTDEERKGLEEVGGWDRTAIEGAQLANKAGGATRFLAERALQAAVPVMVGGKKKADSRKTRVWTRKGQYSLAVPWCRWCGSRARRQWAGQPWPPTRL